MQAWTHTKSGHPSHILKLSDVTKPSLKSPTDVLIQVSHVALHPGASILMQLCPFIFRGTPAIPETDFSGVIVEAGEDIDPSRRLYPGSEVFGSIPVKQHLSQGSGALAQYIVIDAKHIERKPSKLSLEQASGLAVSGCTALALLDKANLKQGDSVLINGASGGIGHMVVQMAKHAVGESGRITGISSGANVRMVEDLGADKVIDYQQHIPLYQHLAECYNNPRFDCVIDAFGVQELYAHCTHYLVEGKPFVSVGVAFKQYTVSSLLYAVLLMLKNNFLPSFLGGGQRPHLQVSSIVTLQGLERLAKLADEDELIVHVETLAPWRRVLVAYEKLLSRRARGKVVVEVQGTIPD